MERKTERFPSTAATCKSRSSGCADGAVAWLLLLASSGDRLVGLRLSRFSVFAFFRSEDLRNSIVETSAAACPSPTPQLSGDRGRFGIVDTILCGVSSSTVPDSGSRSADISARMRGVSQFRNCLRIQNNNPSVRTSRSVDFKENLYIFFICATSYKKPLWLSQRSSSRVGIRSRRVTDPFARVRVQHRNVVNLPLSPISSILSIKKKKKKS